MENLRLKTKTICFLACLIFTFSFAEGAEAKTNTYHIDDMGISVDVPTDYKVLIKGKIDNVANIPQEIGGDKTERNMEKAGIYLKAYNADYSCVVDVAMVENDTTRNIQDFRLMDNSQINTIKEQLLAEDNITGSYIMKGPRAVFLALEMEEKVEQISSGRVVVYNKVIYTVIGGQQISINMNSYGESIGSEEKNLLSDMAFSIKYDQDKYSEINVPVFRLLGVSAIVLLLSAIIGIVVIMVKGKRKFIGGLTEEDIVESFLIEDLYSATHKDKTQKRTSLFYEELNMQGYFGGKTPKEKQQSEEENRKTIKKPERRPPAEALQRKKEKEVEKPKDEKIISIESVIPEPPKAQKSVMDLPISAPGVILEESIELSRMDLGDSEETEEVQSEENDYRHTGLIKPVWEDSQEPEQAKLTFTEEGYLVLDKSLEKILEEERIKAQIRAEEGIDFPDYVPGIDDLDDNMEDNKSADGKENSEGGAPQPDAKPSEPAAAKKPPVFTVIKLGDDDKKSVREQAQELINAKMAEEKAKQQAQLAQQAQKMPQKPANEGMILIENKDMQKNGAVQVKASQNSKTNEKPANIEAAKPAAIPSAAPVQKSKQEPVEKAEPMKRKTKPVQTEKSKPKKNEKTGWFERLKSPKNEAAKTEKRPKTKEPKLPEAKEKAVKKPVQNAAPNPAAAEIVVPKIKRPAGGSKVKRPLERQISNMPNQNEPSQDVTEEIANSTYMRKERVDRVKRKKEIREKIRDRMDEVSIEFEEDSYWNKYK